MVSVICLFCTLIRPITISCDLHPQPSQLQQLAESQLSSNMPHAWQHHRLCWSAVAMEQRSLRRICCCVCCCVAWSPSQAGAALSTATGHAGPRRPRSAIRSFRSLLSMSTHSPTIRDISGVCRRSRRRNVVGKQYANSAAALVLIWKKFY